MNFRDGDLNEVSLYHVYVRQFMHACMGENFTSSNKIFVLFLEIHWFSKVGVIYTRSGTIFLVCCGKYLWIIVGLSGWCNYQPKKKVVGVGSCSTQFDRGKVKGRISYHFDSYILAHIISVFCIAPYSKFIHKFVRTILCRCQVWRR